MEDVSIQCYLLSDITSAQNKIVYTTYVRMCPSKRLDFERREPCTARMLKGTFFDLQKSRSTSALLRGAA